MTRRGRPLQIGRSVVGTLRANFKWVGPSTWQPNWTAYCRHCSEYFDVPSDFYEGLESVGLLIDHYKVHLDRNQSQSALL